MPTTADKPLDMRTIFTGDVASQVKQRDNTVLDTAWVKARFMVPDSSLDADIVGIRFDSMASLKFTNTSIGGNIFVNPRPQFNPLTDPKADNRIRSYIEPNLDPNDAPPNIDSSKSNIGMGEGYSRLIDDNQRGIGMNDIQRDRLGPILSHRLEHRLQLDSLAPGHRVAGAAHHAVHTDFFGVDPAP